MKGSTWRKLTGQYEPTLLVNMEEVEALILTMQSDLPCARINASKEHVNIVERLLERMVGWYTILHDQNV